MDNNKKISRNIPTNVRRKLRQEVNFGCPVENCGSPFLSYHHFDPPWHIKNHHDPDGMIALCLHHHKAADNGAYDTQQLKELKLHPFLTNNDLLIGEISWKRNNILFDLGGNYFLGASQVHLRNKEKLIWIEFDKNGNIMINFDLKSKDGDLVFSMRNNDWVLSTNIKDIETPPAMKKVKFSDNEKGIRLEIEFKSHDAASFIKDYSKIASSTLISNVLKLVKTKELIICKVRGKLMYPFYMHFKDGETNMKNLVGPFSVNGLFNLAEDCTMGYFDIANSLTVGDGSIIT